MPTIRMTDETLRELERVANEFKDMKRPGFESLFKITPDIVVKQLIEDWDNTRKKATTSKDHEVQLMHENQANWEKHKGEKEKKKEAP